MRDHDIEVVAVDFGRKAECIEVADDFIIRHFNAQQTVHLGDGNRQRMRLSGVAGGHFNVNTGNLTAAEFFHQVQRTLHTELCGIFVHTLFKAGRRIGGLTERAGRLTDIVARKLCSFKEDICSRILDFGVQTAHDTCQRNRLVTVTDDEVFGGELEFLFIERNDRFAFLCTADNDLGVFQIVQIKRVHRLSEFLENIVRDIDNIGNCVDADKRQSSSHPCRRRLDLDIGNIVRDIARAEIGRFDCDVE